MFTITITDNRAAVVAPYHPQFVKRVKLLGGKWDALNRTWNVPANAVDSVRSIMRTIYGRDDLFAGETLTVRLNFRESYSVCHAPITMLGRTLASASGRNSGARIGDDVQFLAGAPTSGGSVKYWTTIIPSDSLVRLPDIPKVLIDSAELPDAVDMEIEKSDVNTVALAEEREKLLARITEIDAILERSGDND